jgi:hypothetical protein
MTAAPPVLPLSRRDILLTDRMTHLRRTFEFVARRTAGGAGCDVRIAHQINLCEET